MAEQPLLTCECKRKPFLFEEFVATPSSITKNATPLVHIPLFIGVPRALRGVWQLRKAGGHNRKAEAPSQFQSKKKVTASTGHRYPLRRQQVALLFPLRSPHERSQNTQVLLASMRGLDLSEYPKPRER